MRDYPPPAEYEKMLGSPQAIRAAFKDASLRAVEVEKTPLGLPRARSGAFAVVYRAVLPDQSSCAIRLFLKDGDDRQERYRAVDEHLSRQSLSCLVPFTYSSDSFRAADGRWYPMMTMEWVKGETLFDWLQHRAAAGDQRAIRAVSEKWQKTIRELSVSQIAHGDLQHGNVMITATGDVKLVDYDGMCVPKLVGLRNLEIGVEPYQHPDRDGDTKLCLSLDNFSSLFIYVSLRAVSAEPKLWDEFVVKPGYDKMLFRKEDFGDPRGSALFQRLRRSPDADVQRLASTLHELSRVRIDQVPFLEDLLFSWDQVRVVLDQRDFDAALALVTRGTKQITDAPANLQPRLRDAKQRVEKLETLARAVDAGDEVRMAAEVGSPLLQDYPKASESVAAAVDAPAVLQVVGHLRSLRNASRGRDFVREWDAALPLLRRPKGSLRKSVAEFEADVEAWRQRNRLCDRILRALKTAEPDVAALKSAWQDLARLGGHPDSDGLKVAVGKVIERQKAWTTFSAVGTAISEATDAALIAVWNENAFAGWPKAEVERPRIAQARSRLKAAEAVNQAAAQPLSRSGEENLVRLAAGVPADYAATIVARVEMARRRLSAIEELETAIVADSDSSIASAFRALQSEHAESLACSKAKSRIDLAIRREAVISRLRSIPGTYPNAQAAQWDAKLLAAWDAALLAGSSDAVAWELAVSGAIRRKQLLAALGRAVVAKDALRAVEIDGDPAVKGYPHASAIRRFLQLASRDVSAVRGMLSALANEDRATFVSCFSARVVREHNDAFQAHIKKLLEWTRDEVTPTQRIGLTPAVGVKGVEVREGSSRESMRVTLRWGWPDPRYSDECRVLVCRDRPSSSAAPDDTPSLLRIPKTRDLYESAGGFHSQQFSVMWKGCYVVVWAKVDLGFASIWSEPLVLGKV